MKRFVLEKDVQYLGHWDMVSEYVEAAGRFMEAKHAALAASGMGLRGREEVKSTAA
jgi:hypothetical protein